MTQGSVLDEKEKALLGISEALVGLINSKVKEYSDAHGWTNTEWELDGGHSYDPSSPWYVHATKEGDVTSIEIVIDVYTKSSMAGPGKWEKLYVSLDGMMLYDEPYWKRWEME